MLRQLAWIKWTILAIAFLVVAPIALFASYSWYEMTRPTVSTQSCEPTVFQDKAKQLLISGKEKELIALATAREKTFPQDPYVHLYLGRAYFQLKDYPKAIEAFTTTEALSPDWKEQYIQPFLVAAKQHLNHAAATADTAAPAQPSSQATNYAEAYEKQLKEAAAQLATSDAQQKRMEQLLTIQEQHVKRYGAVLDKWEQQTGLRKK